MSDDRKQFVIGVPVVFGLGFLPSSVQWIKAAYSNAGCAASDLEDLAAIQRWLADTAIQCPEATHKVFLSRTFSTPFRCETVQPIVALTFVKENCSQYWSRAAIGLSRRNEPSRGACNRAPLTCPLIAKPRGVERWWSNHIATSGPYIKPLA
jgi:hypothetical protein